MAFKAEVRFLCILADLFLGRALLLFARFLTEAFALVYATNGLPVLAPGLSLTQCFTGGLRTINLKYFLLCGT